MEVDHPSGIRQCDSVAFLLAIVAPSSWPAPGNKLPFGPLEQHCLSPGGHLRVSSTPLGGVEASPPAAVEAFDFPVGTLSCPELGLAVSHCSWAEGQRDLIVFYMAFPWWLLRLAPFPPSVAFGCPVMGKQAWDLAHSSRRQWLGDTMGTHFTPRAVASSNHTGSALGQICSQDSPMLTPVTYLRGNMSTPFAFFPLLLAFLVFSNSSHYLGNLLCARHHMRSLILGTEHKALLQPVVAGLTHTSSIRPCASAISVFISS